MLVLSFIFVFLHVIYRYRVHIVFVTLRRRNKTISGSNCILTIVTLSLALQAMTLMGLQLRTAYLSVAYFDKFLSRRMIDVSTISDNLYDSVYKSNYDNNADFFCVFEE